MDECGSTKNPKRRVREAVGRITECSPMSLLAKRAVPPFSLAEQRRITAASGTDDPAITDEARQAWSYACFNQPMSSLSTPLRESRRTR